MAAALEVLLDFLAENLTAPADTEGTLRRLEGGILRRWKQMVEGELSREPFAPGELSRVSERYRLRYAAGTDGVKAYGSTLLAACGRGNYWFGIQIGDGSCVAVDDSGGAWTPIPGDARCEMNRTTSLCDADALSEFRHCWISAQPAAVFLGTDGIDNSYSGTEELLRLYLAMALVWAEQGPETGLAEIRDFLPKITSQGSGDDVSLACALRRNPDEGAAERLRAELSARNRAPGHREAEE